MTIAITIPCKFSKTGFNHSGNTTDAGEKLETVIDSDKAIITGILKMIKIKKN